MMFRANKMEHVWIIISDLNDFDELQKIAFNYHVNMTLKVGIYGKERQYEVYATGRRRDLYDLREELETSGKGTVERFNVA